MRHPFFELPTPIVIGHRGSSGEAPENTLPAFARALEQGAAILETDVHATADGVVVVYHDERVERTTDGRGAIAELSAAELRRLDAGYRTAHHGAAAAPPAGAGMQARPFPAPAPGETREVWSSGGLRVVAFAVEHEPVSPAVGYRFEYGGRSVVISGDTRRSANLVASARGADLLVHEALSPALVAALRRAADAAGRANLAKILGDIPDYHTSPVEAAGIAREAGARHLLFTHVVPPLPLPGLDVVFLEGVADAFEGGVTLGRDGTFVSLPSGGDAVEVSSR